MTINTTSGTGRCVLEEEEKNAKINKRSLWKRAQQQENPKEARKRRSGFMHFAWKLPARKHHSGLNCQSRPWESPTIRGLAVWLAWRFHSRLKVWCSLDNFNPGQKSWIGRTPKGAYSSRGRSRHLLETAFSEPLLRTLLRTLFTVKPLAGPLLRTLLRTPSQNPSQNVLRTLLRTLCCHTTP